MRTVGALIIAILGALFDAWLVTLAVGAAHANDYRIPALGFNAVAWLFLALAIVIVSATALTKD